jgi:hypothetical protein
MMMNDDDEAQGRSFFLFLFIFLLFFFSPLFSKSVLVGIWIKHPPEPSSLLQNLLDHFSIYFSFVLRVL